jgi:hypothetical protein
MTDKWRLFDSIITVLMLLIAGGNSLMFFWYDTIGKARNPWLADHYAIVAILFFLLYHLGKERLKSHD